MAEPGLHIVSGKGGVGKTLVAASLAAAYAGRGESTILVTYDVSGSPHPVFAEVPEYEATTVGPDLDLSCLDPHTALLEYVRRNVAFPAAYTPILKNPSVQRFLRALPIFDQLIMLGKIFDLATDESSPYAHVVVDAPATGHCKALLQVADVAARTLVAGPIYTNSLRMRDMLADADISELIIVSLAEATPAREALELYEFARETGLIDCRTILANRIVPQMFVQEEVDRLRAFAGQAHVAAPLSAAVELHFEIANEQSAHLQSLRATGAAVHELPELEEASMREQAGVLCELLRGALLDDRIDD